MLVSVALFEGAVRAACIDSNQSPNWRYHPVLGWSQVSTGSYDIVVDGTQLWAGASDGTVHLLDLTKNTDSAQVAVSFNADLVAVKPK